MKNLLPNSPRFLSAALCLLFSFLANHTRATVYYWDPEGTTTGIYNGDLSGTWESSSWSTVYTGQTPGIAWSEAAVAACFGVGTYSGEAFTMTMNANHTLAGIYDGSLTPSGCNVTINGPGTLTLSYPGGANLCGFDVAENTDTSVGYVTVNVILAGAGILCAEGGGGQLYLNATNTYTGGTQLGYTPGIPFSSTINFSNTGSFGFGAIALNNCSGALVFEGTSAITITNAFVVQAAAQQLNLVGSPAGVTFSGPWNLSSYTPAIGSSDPSSAGNQVILSGVMSGSGGLTGNYSTTPGILMLTAQNTYTGATTVTNGTLQIGDGVSKTGNVAGAITITSPGSLLWENPAALTYTKVMSGTGPVSFYGAGALTLSGACTYSGATTITNGATVKLGVANALSIKSDVNLLGKLDMGGFSTSSGALTGTGTVDNSTGTNTYTLTVNNNNDPGSTTFSGVIQNTVGTNALTLSGTNTSVLSGANTYAGATTISAGTLQVGADNAIPAGSTVVVANGATLDLQGNNDTIAALSVGGLTNGPGSVIDFYGTLTVSGNATPLNGQNYNGYSCISGLLDGSGTLVKGGTHALALRGNNGASYSGPVSLTGGTLSVGALPNALGTGPALSMSGGLFQLDANAQSLASLSGAGSINLGGGVLTIQGGSGSSFSGVIQNSEMPGSSTALGHGLRGYYYTNVDMTVLAAVRDDATVNIPDVQTSLPPSLEPYKTNQISVRWLGQVLTTAAGTYSFVTTCDDGSRLWVNGTLLVDDWTTHGPTARTGTITLAANTRYDIVMEYFNNTDGGSATLSWTPPGDSLVLIPSSNLFLPGPGSLIVGSGGTQVLSGSSTYTGGTTVINGGYLQATANGALGSGSVSVGAGGTGGYLELDASAAIASTADLVLDLSAYNVYLNYSGTDTIHALSLDGGNTYQPAGTYGASGSGATHQISPFTPGTSHNGILNVTAGPSTTALTASTNSVVTASAIYGAPVALTATVAGATGTVAFYDGSANSTNYLGSSPLVSGVAVLSVSNLLVTASPHSLTAVYSGDSTHATSTSSPVSVTTTPATITPVPVIATKTYDGTDNATIASTTFTGILPGDTNYVHISGTYAASFTTPYVGTNKTVNVSGLSLTGSLDGNYQLSSTSVASTGSVTNKTLTVSGLTAANRAYNATTNETATGTAALAGVVSPDSVTLGGTPVFDFLTKYIGTAKPVVVSGYTIPATGIATNYVLVLTNLSANITTFSTTIINVTANNKTYDGVTTATLTGTPALTPAAFAGDQVLISATNVAANFSTATAGSNYTVTVTGYALYGNDATNYAVSQPTGLTANIAKAATTAVITSSANPSAVGSNVAFTYTVTSTTPTTNPPTTTIVVKTNNSSGVLETWLAAATLVSNTPSSSIVSFSNALFPLGTNTVEGIYDGDANFNAPASSPKLLQVVQTNALLSLTSSANPSMAGGNVTFTLTVTATATNHPTLPAGTVTFYTNNVAAGSAVTLASNTTASATATYATALLPSGATTVKAAYSGAGYYLSTNISLSQVVQSSTTCSQTNAILSVTPDGGNIYTLNLIGTYQAQYYILWQTNVSKAMTNWLVVPGSTNTVTNVNGHWSFTVANPAPAFYRVRAMDSCE